MNDDLKYWSDTFNAGLFLQRGIASFKPLYSYNPWRSTTFGITHKVLLPHLLPCAILVLHCIPKSLFYFTLGYNLDFDEMHCIAYWEVWVQFEFCKPKFMQVLLGKCRKEQYHVPFPVHHNGLKSAPLRVDRTCQKRKRKAGNSLEQRLLSVNADQDWVLARKNWGRELTRRPILWNWRAPLLAC